MALDYYYLKNMRKTNPAWRLMTAEHGPFIASFLDSVFREHNIRSIGEAELIMQLEDFLYDIQESEGEESYAKDPAAYLNDWAHNDRGWLRKFYSIGSDEPFYDLTPAAEKALQWMDSMSEQRFIGTESRLYTAFDLLRQIVNGVEENKAERIRDLKQQKREINRQIKQFEQGFIPLLDAREVKERFIQFSHIARELLGDFRMVEHNFRELDRGVREKIAGWSGEKGDLLKDIFGEQDEIIETEQGQSFRAFWDFLMSSTSQEELSTLLERVYSLDLLEELIDDRRLKHIHYEWMNAGEQTQRMVARLSRQLRRFLDDRSYHENRRIVRLLDSIDAAALEIRDRSPVSRSFMELDGMSAEIILPMARPLFTPPVEVELDSNLLEGSSEGIDSEILYQQFVVERHLLLEHIDELLEQRSEVTLREVTEAFPITLGLAELITYFIIAEESQSARISTEEKELITWEAERSAEDEAEAIPLLKAARIPKTVFYRGVSIHE